jgi:hypothetical protein
MGPPLGVPPARRPAQVAALAAPWGRAELGKDLGPTYVKIAAGQDRKAERRFANALGGRDIARRMGVRRVGCSWGTKEP